jgi:predicted amidohydrolase
MSAAATISLPSKWPAGSIRCWMKNNVSRFVAACVQLRSSDDVSENIRAASGLIREARKAGADFVATPENTTLMAADGGAKLELSRPEDRDPALPVFKALAEELGIWLLIGSLAIKVDERKTANRSFLIDPRGTIAMRYDKIHLFDVDLPSGEQYRESNTVAGGSAAVAADLPWGRIGLTICYDVRFPHLYRSLAKAGAFALTVPSAFTETTGKAHWHVLLRARAIENGAFVIAPAQGGTHANGRRTYGHSLIVSPWGEILAEAAIEPGIILAEIDPAASLDARTRIPGLQHDRDYTGP